MRTTDFRIGNIITDENGFEMYVVGIGEDWLTADFDGNQGDVWEFDFKHSFPKPVELTEEILLKCGFVKDEFDNWENETRLGLYKPEEFDGYLSIWGDSTVGECNYLHQLQNLYWCLCGKEIWKLTNEELKVK